MDKTGTRTSSNGLGFISYFPFFFAKKYSCLLSKTNKIVKHMALLGLILNRNRITDGGSGSSGNASLSSADYLGLGPSNRN